VDAEIARGISLRESLRQGGRLWLTCPAKLDEKSRAALWNRSRPVEHFDLFLSHTWMTAGKWKLLSLLLQSGSHKVLFVWVLGVGATAVLTVLGVLPSPWTVHVHLLDCHLSSAVGPWILLASALATVFGLLAAPYFPNIRRRSDVCFMDVASIHQSDTDLMERGIYGIGGFLNISSELRVLWSAPYLSRLWCVFELAAFRTANPSGKITLSPLFVELIVVLILLMQYSHSIFMWAHWAWRGDDEYRHLSHMIGVLPCFFMMHLLRKAHLLKHELFSKLENFDISEAECSSDFDKSFIRAAIVRWYGSEEAFTEFVRGPLRKDLLNKTQSCTFLDYELLLLTPAAASGLTGLCAVAWAGPPVQTLAALAIGSTLGLSIVWVRFCLQLGLFLCDRFARPRWHGIVDYFQTLLLFLVFAAVFFTGSALSIAAHTSSLEASVAFLCFGLLCCSVSERLTSMSWRL